MRRVRQLSVQRHSIRVTILGLIVLGVSAAALAIVAGSRAGSVGGEFTVDVLPPEVTVDATGLVVARFTAASGPGTGSATQVAITLDLPGDGATTGFINPVPSAGCSGPTPSPDHPGYNRFVCTIGTVNAGETVKRFVTFRAPPFQAPPVSGPDPNVYVAYGFVTFDTGNSGAPGGGSSVRTEDDGQTTVAATTNNARAGKCSSGTPPFNVSTSPVSASDRQATALSFGNAAFSLPCTWASLGEDSAPGFKIPFISFVNAPVFSSLATLQISIYQLPPSQIGTLLEFPNYPALDGALPVLLCPSPTTLPPGRDACELPRTKKGNVTFLNLLFAGTGGDPGFGGG